MSFVPPRWRNKIRRHFYSPYNKLVYRGRYFICRYFGAEFLVRSANVGGLEISAKIAEYPELKNFLRRAAAIEPDWQKTSGLIWFSGKINRPKAK